MELRDLAEQVLCATTLEEKLRCPELITDEQPGSAMVAPEVPGRPAELHFKSEGSRSGEFPGLHRLERAQERGRLLHFFANHELLATELMALVLLRFPEAPTAFRRGVLQTLRDEQEHTRLYLQRMRECGIHFGDLPVSGYFWRAVSKMESPMDYVAGLSLTFEQANLDFARQFSKSFEATGDSVTAKLLDRIYRDEIGHVAYGLKWFRRWKNPADDDWQAFRKQLKFPLSPQRAKGSIWNVEGRRAAGLHPEFIAELNVYSQSKGRTPSVFVFNPFAEGRIAQGKSFTPVKHQAQLARDLASLPQYLCRQDDIVLLSKRPSIQFLDRIKQAGFPLPEFVEIGHAIPREGSLATRKIGGLRPWAWGPDSVELFQPLFANVTGETRCPERCFNEGIAAIYSKAWSAQFLSKVLEISRTLHAGEPWLCTQSEVGVPVGSLAAATDVIDAIRRRGHHRIVVKQVLGLAGQNALRLWEPKVLESQHRWMTNALENGRQLIVEPWLERLADFSIQLEMTGRSLNRCGFTGLVNDRRGQFVANWAEPHYERRLPKSVSALFVQPTRIEARLQELYSAIQTLLAVELRTIGYVGPISIDALAYRAEDGSPRIKPIVEINPRYTMGRLTLELMQRTAPGSHGLFRLVTRSMVRTAGCADFGTYAQALQKQSPLVLEGTPVPRIGEGLVCLNDSVEAQVCLALFQVSRSLDSLKLPRLPD